jgi:hypothetical protein
MIDTVEPLGSTLADDSRQWLESLAAIRPILNP